MVGLLSFGRIPEKPLSFLFLDPRLRVFQRDATTQDKLTGRGVIVEGAIAEALGLPDLSPGVPPETSSNCPTYRMPNVVLKTGFTHHPLGLARLEIL